MSKPILIIKFPASYPPQVAESVIEHLNNREDLVNDYHIFTIPNGEDNFDFKVFNGQHTEVEYQQLVELIEELKNK